jgi:hypothetical protein
MRSLGFWALCAGSAMAVVSALFVLAIRHSDTSLSKQVCMLGGGLCERPSLLLVPILATVGWGAIIRMCGE